MVYVNQDNDDDPKQTQRSGYHRKLLTAVKLHFRHSKWLKIGYSVTYSKGTYTVFRSVCRRGGGGGVRADLPLEADLLPPEADPPQVLTSSGGHFSGRYTSYWNAFLLKNILV